MRARDSEIFCLVAPLSAVDVLLLLLLLLLVLIFGSTSTLGGTASGCTAGGDCFGVSGGDSFGS